MRYIRACAFTAAAIAVLANAATASADTTIGQTAAPDTPCSPGTLYQGQTGATPHYATPSGRGVITSWTVQTDANVAPIKLKVLRAVGDGTYRITGESEQVTPTANSTQAFQSRIPVGATQYLGLSVLSGSADCRFSTANYNDAVRESSTVDPPVGSAISVPTSHPNSRLDVSAVVEPDADDDGYGDTTQDACPTDPSTHDVCEADLSLHMVSIFNSPRVGHNITWSATVTNHSPNVSPAQFGLNLPVWVRIRSITSSNGGGCFHFYDNEVNEQVARCREDFPANRSVNILVKTTPLASGFVVADGGVDEQFVVPDPNPSNNSVRARRYIYGRTLACANTLHPSGILILGSKAGDRLHGTRGADTIYGYSGPDCLYGEGGNDRVYGGRGNDVVRGGRGNDRLFGGGGRDRLYGGRGNDSIHARHGDRDRISCGPGRDRVYADLRDRVSRDCERVVRSAIG